MTGGSEGSEAGGGTNPSPQLGPPGVAATVDNVDECVAADDDSFDYYGLGPLSLFPAIVRWFGHQPQHQPQPALLGGDKEGGHGGSGGSGGGGEGNRVGAAAVMRALVDFVGEGTSTRQHVNTTAERRVQRAES